MVRADDLVEALSERLKERKRPVAPSPGEATLCRPTSSRNSGAVALGVTANALNRDIALAEHLTKPFCAVEESR